MAYRNLNLSFPAQSTRPEDKDVLRCPYLSGIQARRHPDIRKTRLSSTNPHPLLLQLNYNNDLMMLIDQTRGKAQTDHRGRLI